MSCRNRYTQTHESGPSSTDSGKIKAFFSGNIFSDNVLNTNIMRSILYILAVILIIGWLLGVFYWSAGGLIHILIVIAVIALILAIIRRA